MVNLHVQLTPQAYISVEAGYGDTVAAFKQKIMSETGLELSRFGVAFQGEQLTDGDVMGGYAFEDGSELEVVMEKKQRARDRLSELEWNEGGATLLVQRLRRVHGPTYNVATEDAKYAEIITEMYQAELFTDDEPISEAFLLACCRGLVKCVSEFLSLGLVDIEDKPDGYGGHTGLLHASYYGKPDAVKLLLSYGADRKAKSCYGKTAIDYAREKGFEQIEQLLLTY
eukprot:TRINITY_DN18_c0_g1_i2.p1 TRINITY_DN18_c0_g1~~TRINITY_DN18_c0_g1_i2.p1  ORF type:complete len:227 (+),score=26.19 TRINITY_DN18_c0_g1_i2:95-775(+)